MVRSAEAIERQRQRSRQYALKNKEKVRAIGKAWRLKNKEKIAYDNKLYAAKNKEKIKSRIKLWSKNNKDKLKAIKLRYKEKLNTDAAFLARHMKKKKEAWQRYRINCKDKVKANYDKQNRIARAAGKRNGILKVHMTETGRPYCDWVVKFAKRIVLTNDWDEVTCFRCNQMRIVNTPEHKIKKRKDMYEQNTMRRTRRRPVHYIMNRRGACVNAQKAWKITDDMSIVTCPDCLVAINNDEKREPAFREKVKYHFNVDYRDRLTKRALVNGPKYRAVSNARKEIMKPILLDQWYVEMAKARDDYKLEMRKKELLKKKSRWDDLKEW